MNRVANSQPFRAAAATAAILLLTTVSVSGASPFGPTHEVEPAVPATSGGGPADLPDGTWYDPATGTVRSDALEVDAARIASRDGTTTTAAKSLLIAQDRMDEILPKAQALYPELVGIRWADGGVIAQFKGQPTKGAMALLSAAGVTVAPESVKYSASEVDKMRVDLGKALASMGVADYVVAFEPEGQRIIASVSSANAARLSDGAAISKQSISAALPAQLAGANVDIQIVAGPVSQATTAYGGTEARVGSTFICTIGFTVSNGVSDGVATAGHCGTGLNSYRDWVTGTTHTMTWKASHHDGPWGDFVWYTTSGTEVDDFYTEGGTRRDVTGVVTSIGQGAEFLWYGRASKNDWLSWVEWPTVDTTGPLKRLACMHDYHVVGGDSGGPVYINGKAGGFIWGWVLIDGSRRDCFSRAHYIDDALGLGIKW